MNRVRVRQGGMGRKRGIAAPLVFAATAFWMAAAAAATGGEAGVWRMSLDDTNRACSMVLRDDENSGANALSKTLAMPAGCRRALPILMDVTAWEKSDDGLALLDQSGAPVLRFAAAGARGYLARGPEGETYALKTDADAPVQMAQANGAKPRAAAAAPAVRVSEIAGRYAVLRDEGRDTGCMVTLFETARGRGAYRALLAPACRDQGVVIFDPQAWTIDRGKLSLTARKGHKLLLEPAGDGVWWFKDDKRNLGLRKI